MNQLPQPGWYPDPDDQALIRYWDGSRWTDQRATAAPGGMGAAAAPGAFGAPAGGGFGQPGPPGAPMPPYAAQQTNGLAIASLVLGILWLFWLGSVLALVFGYVGKNQIDESGGRQGGRGLAIAGIVLGWIGVGTLIAFLIAYAADPESFEDAAVSLDQLRVLAGSA